MSGLTDHEKWIRLAEQDWLCVQNELMAMEKPWSVIGFHCQQAAEKYLKAYLTFKGVDPDKTHDLSRLLQACGTFDETLRQLADACDSMAYYAVDARYDHEDEFSEDSAREAVDAAAAIKSAVLSRI